jgi:YVTN family beta-propeller protein
MAGTGICAAVIGGLATAAVAAGAPGGGFGQEQVGHTYANGILLPTNQWVKPIGTRILDRHGRLLSSSISPNGTFLAALTWNFLPVSSPLPLGNGFLTIINLKTGKIVQQVGTGVGKDKNIGDGTVAADGPLWSADGRTLWFPQSKDLLRFSVAPDGMVSAQVTIPLEQDTTTTGTTNMFDMPSGMALGPNHRLYVALNGINELGVINTVTDKLARIIPVGNAPRQVVLANHGRDAFVSNEGGRPARPGDFINSSYGTAIVANRVTGAAATGTVSEVNLATGKEVKEIPVGLEPTAEYLAPDGTLMVANSNDDTFSLINTRTATVAQTVNVNPLPGSTVGSYPNAITMPDPGHILVSIGRDNALAVYGYNGPTQPVQYQGLLPTDFYPVGAAYDKAIGKIVVTNDKGTGARGPKTPTPYPVGPGNAPGKEPVTGHATYDDTGSVTEFTMPSMAALGGYTHQVFVNNGWDHLLASTPVRDCRAAPLAVPRRLGCPSPIKHVFLIIRENRSYDQILGDIAKGNSDPKLAQFGATITPNAHALARTFGLFDNFYDPASISTDGHNWLVQADSNDYLEKEFGAFRRSYPAQGGDALVYQRDGFLWNAAVAAGQTVKVYGEYNLFLNQPANGKNPNDPVPSWSAYYRDSQILEGKKKGPLPVPESETFSYSDVPSVNAVDDHAYPGFNAGIPDQYRADIWEQSFARSEKTGRLANLNLIYLPDDHTGLGKAGYPDPVAEVADNDLATGRIIDTISHSRFWKSSAVFVVEDDTQLGLDHVDGHRGPLLIASPYARRGITDSTYDTQLNMLKTIEQILGIAPMNQEDRAAYPMFSAFTNTPDLTPYNARPSQIPLTKGLVATTSATGMTTYVPATPAQLGIPRAERAVYQAWVAWGRNQRFSGPGAVPDWANPAQLSRFDWYSAHNWRVPYPGDKTILPPGQVPGHNLPAGYLGD